MMLTACDTGTDGTGSRDAKHQATEHMPGHETPHEMAPENSATTDDRYVGDFTLLDQNGASHNLYYYEDAPAIAIMIQGNGCPIVRNVWTDYSAVRDEFERQGIPFFMLNANLQDKRSTIKAEADKFSYDMPILEDTTQLVAEALGVTRTAEVLVINPSDWSILYRGPINNRVGYGQQRKEASEHFLKGALNAALNGDTVETQVRSAKGCIVNLPETKNQSAHAQVSYSKTIAPMLAENCAMCHQEGGIAPWAMTDYSMIQGFAPMIREVVLTKRMPPWSADPEVGTFHNERRLSAEQQKTLVHWIEAGAPRGDGPDPLESRVVDATVWPLGEPDLIIEAPGFDVPASGVVDYQFPTALNPMDRDVWIRAVTVVPGDKTVVHHALVGSSETVTEPGEGNYQDVFDNYLIGYVPGAESYVYPEGTGVQVKAGGEFRFQMHYTPSGAKTVDKTRLGLYFYKTPPKYRLRQQVALNLRLDIPPETLGHIEQAYFEFDHPATLYMLFPHSHFRGKSSTFKVTYPDGREDTILSVPAYDFNWQHTYSLREPLEVPKGTRLIHRTAYDNTARNPSNPDPSRNVPWGLQSADEMLYGSFMFRWTEETENNPVHDELEFDTRQFYGFADKNMNGKLERNEMHGGLARSWDEGRMKGVDQDSDGALSFAEFYGMRKAQEQQRQKQNSR
jgi:mono/diheme cytochrome c family protein/peroxiredoxin